MIRPNDETHGSQDTVSKTDLKPLTKQNRKPVDPITPVAVDARGVATMFSLSIRTVRRLDSSGRLPSGFKIGGRKLWRIRDLQLWSDWGFPCRGAFQDCLRTEARKTGSRA